MYTYKVMIHPNNKQETKIRRTLNKCIECNHIVYDYLDNFIKQNKKIPSIYEVRRWFTAQKEIKDQETINKRIGLTKKAVIEKHLDTCFYDVSNDALKQAVKDTYNSFLRSFKKISEYPNKKSFKDYKKSFYVDPYKIEFTDKKVKLEKISNSQKESRRIINYISLAERERIPTNTKYYNPRVVLIGDKFYIVVSVSDEDYLGNKNKKELDSEKIVGIDININSVVTSDNTKIERVTTKDKYHKIEKRFKKEQEKLSHKYEILKKEKRKIRNSKNYLKQKKKVNKYRNKVNNLINNDINEIITDIINLRPSKVVIETLDVKDMKEQDNKYIRKGIQKNPFSKLLNKLKERLNKVGIEIVEADKWYPSSKKCSNCGNIKEDLSLSDRIYRCPKCGLVIDRDYNASINLKNYCLSK